MSDLLKYPRTHHLEGSRFQHGDEDLESVPFSTLRNQWLVVEEKMDGSNCAVSFSAEGRLQLQSRGHYLTGGARERQFNLFKTWASSFSQELHKLLGQRYIMYGEWLYAKHTIYYDALPHYFMEFDIYDRHEQLFLSTRARRRMLQAYPFIVSVKVLEAGRFATHAALVRLVDDSHFISPMHLDHLQRDAEAHGVPWQRALTETDNSPLMEGLYLKTENEQQVLERYKFVRGSFLNVVQNSMSHWMDRPIIPNRLADGIDLFARCAP